nr:IS630 family transposase [Candidatus Sigynarchaeota archaeon]
MEKKMWCVPTLSSEYIERMEDVLDLYAKQYNPDEPVIGVDEKTLQLLDHLHSPLPMSSTHGTRVDYQYKRNGSVNIFVGIEPKGGRRRLIVKAKKERVDFLAFLFEINIEYPDAIIIHLILDNLSSHCEKGICEAERMYPFLKRFKFHFTPKHASWLNVAELEIGVLERQCLKDTRFPTIPILEDAVDAWQQDRNECGTKIKWKFTTADARKAFKYSRNRLN